MTAQERAETTSSDSSPEKERTILVIGSGLAGLATAIGLAALSQSDASAGVGNGDFVQRGCRTTSIEVVEKRPEYNVRGAAFGLAPNGMKALREVCPEVATTLLEEGIYMDITGGHMLPWYRVREALLKHAQSFSSTSNNNGSTAAHIRFRMGWTLDRIEQDLDDNEAHGALVRAFFTNGKVLVGSLLIAADGIHSKVRSLLQLEPALQPPASRVWRGHVQVPEDSALYRRISTGGIMPLGSMFHGPTMAVAFSFHEKTPGAAAWAVSTKEPGVVDRNTSVWTVLGAFLEAAQAEGEGRGPESNEALFCELLRLTPESDLTNVYDNTVVRLPDEDGSGWGGQGRVVLVGDAAHAMRPASGLGGAMAFEDAQLLCRKLKPWMTQSYESIHDEVDASEPKKSLPELLREFENERLVRVRRIWNVEWEISESAYKKPVDRSSLTDDDYKAWLFAGI